MHSSASSKYQLACNTMSWQISGLGGSRGQKAFSEVTPSGPKSETNPVQGQPPSLHVLLQPGKQQRLTRWFLDRPSNRQREMQRSGRDCEMVVLRCAEEPTFKTVIHCKQSSGLQLLYILVYEIENEHQKLPGSHIRVDLNRFVWTSQRFSALLVVG